MKHFLRGFLAVMVIIVGVIIIPFASGAVTGKLYNKILDKD